MGGRAMTYELYACLYAREFPVQALLRLRPELREQPCVVMAGDAPLEQVCSLNTKARLLGMVRGMTRVEVDTFPASSALARSVKEEAATRAILLECAGAFSPRLEEPNVVERSQDAAFTCGIDIAGTRSLFGPPEVLARKLVERVRAVGMRACATVSSNLHAAECMARGLPPNIAVRVISQGEEAAALAELPFTVLDPTREQAATLAAWGMHTLGMLAAPAGKGPRLRAWGRRAAGFGNWRAASGRICFSQSSRPRRWPSKWSSILPWNSWTRCCLSPEPCSISSSCAPMRAWLRWPQSTSHSRSTVAARTRARCGRRCQPTTNSSGSGCSIWIWKRIRHMRPCLPSRSMQSRERRARCSSGCSRRNCLRPRGSTLRWRASRAVVGEENVGRAVLLDAHTPDAFRIEAFRVAEGEDVTTASTEPRAAVRQLRPAESVTVTLEAQRPMRFTFRGQSYKVDRAYGPWLTGGDWWQPTLWGHEQWDIVARAGDNSLLCCCLVRDLMHSGWQMVSLYD
jgi:protein ImuB